MTIISLIGMKALNTAVAAKRMPEIFNVSANLWRPARSYGEARQLIGQDQGLVRMVCDARILLEDLGSVPINIGDNLQVAALNLPSSVPFEVFMAVETAISKALED
jgi:hypothetical protein